MFDKCNNENLHTPQPEGYLERHYWVMQMARHYRQKKCHGCGLWQIREPKITVREKSKNFIKLENTYANK